MRTLSTQVRLRRLIRAFDEALNRLLSDPHERRMAGSASAKLLELLHQDFEGAALPLEIFMRGLDSEPALQRSA
jgi:hypothetical protein